MVYDVLIHIKINKIIKNEKCVFLTYGIIQNMEQQSFIGNKMFGKQICGMFVFIILGFVGTCLGSWNYKNHTKILLLTYFYFKIFISFFLIQYIIEQMCHVPFQNKIYDVLWVLYVILCVLLFSFSPSDNKFVTCSDDGTLRIWDFFRYQEERILRGNVFLYYFRKYVCTYMYA